MSSTCVAPLNNSTPSTPNNFTDNQRDLARVSHSSLLVDVVKNRLSKPYDSHIVHWIKDTDTLPSISSLYCVPISDLKKLNCLTSQEIWFRKTLLIPYSERQRATLQPPEAHVADGNTSRNDQKSMEIAAAESQKVSAMKKLVDLDQAILRELLITQGWDLRRTIKIAEWIQKMTKHGALDPDIRIDEREALAYLEMNNYNLIRAEMQLEADVRWEKSLQGSPEQFPTCGTAATYLWRLGMNFRPTSVCGRWRKDHNSQLLDHDVGQEELTPLDRDSIISASQLMRTFTHVHDEKENDGMNTLRSRRLTANLEHSELQNSEKHHQSEIQLINLKKSKLL